jgi:uncharacterized protein
MVSAFLDTSYLLALELANDQNHEPAIKHWHRFLNNSPRLVTTSFILDEVVTFFNSRGHHAKAVEVGNNLLTSSSIEFIHVEAALLLEAWSYFQRHKDKDYSLTDCISFVVMSRLSLTLALTFDKHFEQAGFNREP